MADRRAVLMQDLDDILRHGAEELFAEDQADETTQEALKRKRITYDDSALSALLDREARLKEAEADDEGGGGFMDDFKARPVLCLLCAAAHGTTVTISVSCPFTTV